MSFSLNGKPGKPAPRPAADPVAGESGDGKERAAVGKAGARIPDPRWESISGNLKTIGGAVLLALVIRTLFFEAFEIEGPSMEPTLLNGDRVVVAKFAYGLFLPLARQATLTWGKPALGDVVIIKSPADNVDIVKRVVGLPGDTIAFRSNNVYRNGKPMKAEDMGPCSKGRGKEKAPACREIATEVGEVSFRTSGVPLRVSRPAVAVPAAHVYVLGDHRDSSNDSRSIGVIPFDRLKGKALAIYWSSGQEGFRWGRIFSAVR
jgi:signal peptidase I